MLADKSAILEAITQVAQALGELNDRIVYVGGAVAGFYADDPGAAEIRPTKDIDIVFEIVSALELEDLRQKLAQRGFHNAKDANVICRFHYGDILLDVMATQNIGWAPANPWFQSGFDRAEIRHVNNLSIRIMPFPYYLAAKFVAANDRGKDPRTSHDFEDIVFLLDNRTTLIRDILESEPDVKAFLINEFNGILRDVLFQEALLAHLEPATQTRRFERLKQKMLTIVAE